MTLIVCYDEVNEKAGVMSLNKLEKLEQDAFDRNIRVHHYYLGEPDLKGLYMDGNIALNTTLDTNAERSCTLAEEMGHHETTVGDITDMTYIKNRKQERQARLWGYNEIIGLRGLLKAYEHGCQNRCEIAEYLEVTEEFLQECINCYRDKYGVGKMIDNYYIMFIPRLAVGKIVN